MHNFMILQSFISIKIIMVHKSAPKPSPSRSNFEQLYIANLFQMTPNFVDMLKTPNDDTTPSGASRGIVLHD